MKRSDSLKSTCFQHSVIDRLYPIRPFHPDADEIKPSLDIETYSTNNVPQVMFELISLSFGNVNYSDRDLPSIKYQLDFVNLPVFGLAKLDKVSHNYGQTMQLSSKTFFSIRFV